MAVVAAGRAAVILITLDRRVNRVAASAARASSRIPAGRWNAEIRTAVTFFKADFNHIMHSVVAGAGLAMVIRMVGRAVL